MSNNHNLYRNVLGKTTFPSDIPTCVPPPPTPPPYFLPPIQQWPTEISDIDFIKRFEKIRSKTHVPKSKTSISISKVRDEIRNLVLALNEIKMKEKILTEKLNDLSNDEWNSYLKQIDENKTVVSKIFSNINNLNTEVLRKLLAKRSAKRARQKRQRIEKKKEKEEKVKQNKEKSLKIDEYLQKFQDEINKIKQEEESKLQADAVLRETISKKHDAKKYIVKLDALIKLRKARQNTAKGRGENVSEKEAEVFESNIEKLKTLWMQRLEVYKKEETELRAKLVQDVTVDTKTTETEREVTENLGQWKYALFGGTLPQVDFAGDVGRFLAVRSQWDHYLNSDGSAIPIGWVPPTAKNDMLPQS